MTATAWLGARFGRMSLAEQFEAMDVFSDQFQTVLRRSELYVADDAMTQLVEQASRSFEPQTLLPSDPVCPRGMLLFASPLEVHTSQPGPWDPVRGIVWSPILDPASGPGFVVTALTPKDSFSETMYGDSTPPPLVPECSFVWPTEQAPPENEGTKGVFTATILATFWTLVLQRGLSSRADERPVRNERKLAARRGVERPDEDVRVVYLRHRDAAEAQDKPGDTEEIRRAKREYRHQWIVRGFWRNTWFPSLETHRQQFIAPHVRGPAGKPLLGGDRVTVVSGPEPKPGEPDVEA